MGVQELVEPRVISKQHDQGGRKETADKIKLAREKMRALLDGQTQNKTKVEGNNKRIEELNQSREASLAKLEEAQNRLRNN